MLLLQHAMDNRYFGGGPTVKAYVINIWTKRFKSHPKNLCHAV